jgi:predicted permease
MRWLKESWRRFRSLWRRDALETGLDEEIRFHLGQQTEKNLRAGMSAAEARRQALIRFGGRENVKERTRDQFRPVLLDDSLRDLRYSIRSLRRAPGFTILASGTLALGIGATTAIFAVVNGVLIKPLPYPNSEALVAVWHTAPGLDLPQMQASPTQYLTYREESRAFAEIGLYLIGPATVMGVAEPEEVRALIVTYGVLQALGVPQAVGRSFSQEDHAPGSPQTVMLTYGYWQRRFGGDPSVVGRTLTVQSQLRTVIGVMPDGFHFPDEIRDLVLPIQLDRNGLTLGGHVFSGVARLKPGVTVAEANADVERMIPLWLEAWPPSPVADPQMFGQAQIGPSMRSLKAEVVGDIGSALWVLMGTIGIMLLIACANAANLLLVRAEGRQRELAVRVALGAGWYRVARELLLESVVLGMLGGALGLGLAVVGLPVLVALGPEGVPRLEEIGIDPAVLAFTVIVSLLSGIVLGLVPVARYARPRIATELRAGERASSGSRERHRAKNTLVVAQVALALVLLIGSGLMIRTLLALRAVQPGFANPEQIQLVRITLPLAHVDDLVRVFNVQSEILDQIAAVPGVSAAAFIRTAPLGGFNLSDPIFAEDRQYANGELPPVRRFKFVSPGFFRTIGTPLVVGRDYTWAELRARRAVAIISENLARELWREPAAALGQRIREDPNGSWREIVGVVGDMHDDGVDRPAPAIVYWPALMENFYGSPVYAQRLVAYAVRSDRVGTESFVKELQAAVWAVDPSRPLGIRTLGEAYHRSFARTSFTLVMLAIAAGMALLLGLLGIYGVIAYAISQRTREIGIRVALGAQQSELKRMFVRSGLTLAAGGVVCGLAAAVVLTRLMNSLLFGIEPLDPITYVAVSLALISAAALASYVPARRATMVDPVVALRSE